jgi:hypothetical protein
MITSSTASDIASFGSKLAAAISRFYSISDIAFIQAVEFHTALWGSVQLLRRNGHTPRRRGPYRVRIAAVARIQRVRPHSQRARREARGTIHERQRCDRGRTVLDRHRRGHCSRRIHRQHQGCFSSSSVSLLSERVRAE